MLLSRRARAAVSAPLLDGYGPVWRPWVSRIAARRLALVGATIALITGTMAIATSLAWPGRVFPGFFVLETRMIPSIGLYSWTGIRDGVPFHSTIESIDARPVRSADDVYAQVAALPASTAVRYGFAKRGERLERIVPTMRFGWRDFALTLLPMLVFGIASAVSGVSVGLLQPESRPARAYLAHGVVSAAFAFTGCLLYWPGALRWGAIHLLAQALFPASLVHLGLVFPTPRSFVPRRQYVIPLVYLAALGLTVWEWHGFFADPPDLRGLDAAYVATAIGIVALVACLAHAYWEAATPGARVQVRLVLIAMAIGTAVPLYGFAIGGSRDGGDFPINFVAVTPLIPYLAIGYAILRHDLLGIDAIARQAVVYAVLTLAVTAVHAGAVGVTSLLVPEGTAPGSLFTIAFVIGVAILFQPARAGVQRLVDRIFFRDRADYRRTVGDLSTGLATLLDLDECLDRVGRTVAEGLHLTSLTAVLWLEDDTFARTYQAGTRAMTALAPPDCAALRARVVAEPHRIFAVTPEDTAPPEREAFALGARLVLPLAVAGRPLGVLLLGRTRSGRFFGAEDIELLRTLAAQTAVALSNAHAYRALERANTDLEAKVEARTAALRTAQAQLVQREKMASLGVLVAGVAHEINNPVTFIVGGVDPLRAAVEELRGFAAGHPDAGLGAAVERATRATDAIARGAGRTASIVRDLRTFSRPSDTRRRPVDLHEGIDTTVRLLHPRWAERVEVHRDYGTLPPVAASGEELNQVWMNVLANACDAGAHGNVWITTRASATEVTVTVRDDGSGIAPEHLPQIFDPFFTTKPPGEGTGLGLAIAHGIVTQHGGRIEVASAPGEGTTFTITLPLSAGAPGVSA